MQKELLHQAMALFDTPEKWSSFLELAYQKDNMRDAFTYRVKAPLYKYFIENPVDKWDFEPWGEARRDIRWYLKDFGKSSLALAVGWWFEFHLHLEDIHRFDASKMNALLKTPEYTPLLAAFDRIDRQFETQTKAMERRSYSFDVPGFESNTDWADVDQFAWFAGNYPESLSRQIIDKVEKFRKNDALTDLLYKLNEQCKK